MNYLSVCSGIEAVTVAWENLGFTPVAFSEIEKFPSALLDHHYPNVPNLGDMLEIDGYKYKGEVDVLVGGTPCQSFSVAGRRESLSDYRGNLTLKFANLADQIEPKIILWENVPGVLSTKDNAFGCFLAALAGEDRPLEPSGKRWTNAGYVLGPKRAIAWRILDAQYFGVAQRRRRLFVVGCPRNGTDPRKILFECEGLRRDTAQSREKREDLAGTLTEGFGSRGVGADQIANDNAVVTNSGNISYCLSSGQQNRQDAETETFIAFTQENEPKWEQGDEVGHTLGTYGDRRQCVAFTQNDAARDALKNMTPTQRTGNSGGVVNQCVAFHTSGYGGQIGEVSQPIQASDAKLSNQVHGIIEPRLKVRRLTPVECERLQGFPDNYTNIPFGRPKHKDQICPDGHRYKALGNSMAVPVIRWLGERILEHCTQEQKLEKVNY